MNKSKEEIHSPKGSEELMTTLAKTQQQGIEEAEKILDEVLRMGISAVDIEYAEEICYDIEGLTDYFIPGVLKDFRLFFIILCHANNPAMFPDLLAYVNYLIAVVEEEKKYLKLRTQGAKPDITSVVETHLGYLWRNINLLKYKMYEEGGEIIQLSFSSTKDLQRMSLTDKAYWFNLNTGRIHFTSKIRPIHAAKYIKENDTELDILQPEKLFVYPGRLNSRIRWDHIEKRKITPSDIKRVWEGAEDDYAGIITRVKENFRDPLAERSAAILLRLHKTFINGDHLVLEDEKGGLLTVKDLPEDDAPTSELLRTILPSNPERYALLVEVNDDLQTNLFSVKPLTIVNPDRIIRLLY